MGAKAKAFYKVMQFTAEGMMINLGYSSRRGPPFEPLGLTLMI